MTQQLPLYQMPMTQPNFVNNPILTPDQQNELQPIANNLIASQPQQNYNLPPLQPQLQPDNTVPSFVNNPNLSVQQKQAMLNAQQPQVVANVSPQTMAIAGAQKKGIDWAGLLGTLGSYVSAAGSAYGTGANPSQGLLNAANATQKLTQNIRQYDAMAPKFQQMGYDVSGYDPRRGGAGIATTPAEMVDLQSKIAERDYLNDYRQTMAQARAAQAQQTADTKGVTIGTLRMMSPQFKKMIDAQYGFGSGQNLKLLDQVIPASMVQGYMPAVTKTNNMVYSGGLHSSQNKTGRSDIYHHSNGGSGGGKGKSKPNSHIW